MNKDTQELMPCPFCGYKDTHIKTAQWKNTKSFETYVFCGLCYINGPSCVQRNPNELGVINASELWNTRHTPDIDQAIEDISKAVVELEKQVPLSTDSYVFRCKIYDIKQTLEKLKGKK